MERKTRKSLAVVFLALCLLMLCLVFFKLISLIRGTETLSETINSLQGIPMEKTVHPFSFAGFTQEKNVGWEKLQKIHVIFWSVQSNSITFQGLDLKKQRLLEFQWKPPERNDFPSSFIKNTKEQNGVISLKVKYAPASPIKILLWLIPVFIFFAIGLGFMPTKCKN